MDPVGPFNDHDVVPMVALSLQETAHLLEEPRTTMTDIQAELMRINRAIETSRFYIEAEKEENGLLRRFTDDFFQELY